jgi:hypothetical protein
MADGPAPILGEHGAVIAGFDPGGLGILPPMQLRRGHSRSLSEVNLQDSPLARRLSELRWPTPPPGARERGWIAVQERLKEYEREQRAAAGTRGNGAMPGADQAAPQHTPAS